MSAAEGEGHEDVAAAFAEIDDLQRGGLHNEENSARRRISLHTIAVFWFTYYCNVLQIIVYYYIIVYFSQNCTQTPR